MRISCLLAILAASDAFVHPAHPRRAVDLRQSCCQYRSAACRDPRSERPKMHLVPAVVGGTLAGSLHAISGPDHLAALLPLCTGRAWSRASTTGALWGLGHGVGAALVGALGFALRGALNMDAVSRYMEVAVGVSIAVIGATGFQEAREWAHNANNCELEYGDEDLDGSVDSRATANVMMSQCDEPPPQDVGRTQLNGILNGICGTGHVLGVLPALAMPSWTVASAYLVCFGLGTLLAMAIVTGVIGELSLRMGSGLNQRAAPANLAMATSIIALTMGGFWTTRALAGLGIPGLSRLWRTLSIA